jgi:hypothetical protein
VGQVRELHRDLSVRFEALKPEPSKPRCIPTGALIAVSTILAVDLERLLSPAATCDFESPETAAAVDPDQQAAQTVSGSLML